MTKCAVLLIVLALTAWLCLILPVQVRSAWTIVVPDDYPTIQAAIDKANAGDTVFVKKGTYYEQTLEIKKALFLLGEDVDKTIINLNPPLVNYTLIYLTSLVHSTAITISTNDVKLSGFTINMPTDGIASLGGIIANGDNIEIVGNKLGRECNLQLTGTLPSVIDNSIKSSLGVIGPNQTITNNLLEEGLDTQGSYSRITGNTINGAVILKNGSFNLILNNSFSMMLLEYYDSNFISNNTFRYLDIGFYGHGCSNNTVNKNRVTGPGDRGILMGTGSYNVFHDNLISNYTGGPSGYGIAIGRNLVAEHNIFYRNILMNNEVNVGANWDIEEVSNLWDNGKEGNFWDDYSGTDSNGDGIGDVPFLIEGLKWDDEEGGIVGFVFGQDNYPLMAPFDIDSVSIELPDWASTSSNSSFVPQSEPFPILPVVAVSLVVVAVVAAGVLVYFKKRKHQSIPSSTISNNK